MPLQIAAALAVKKIMEQQHLQGTLKLWPGVAEELLGTKAYYVRAGAFKDVDICIFAHVGANMQVSWGDSGGDGMVSVEYDFKGESAHAAGAPWRGRSALDAVEAMDNMVNMMREHVPQETRIHYIITRGGAAPNVVPDFAEAYYYARHPNMPILDGIWERILNTAKGAALGTGTTVEATIPYEASRATVGVLRAELVTDLALPHSRPGIFARLLGR